MPTEQHGDLVGGGVLVEAGQHQLLGARQPADVAQPVLEALARRRPRHGEWSAGPSAAARTRPRDRSARPRWPGRPTARRRRPAPWGRARSPGSAGRRPRSSASRDGPLGRAPSEGRISAAPGTASIAARSASSASPSHPSSASTNGWYIASTAPNRRHWPHNTCAPSSLTSSQTRRTRVVLPTPASPWTSTARGEPSRPARTTSSNLARSSARPDSVAVSAGGLMTSSVTPWSPTVAPLPLGAGRSRI